PSTELVGKIRDTLGIKALAFDPCDRGEFNVAQVEGIMLALRALRSNDINRLRAAFKSLAKRTLTQKEMTITDIDEFARSMTFTLPAAKVLDTEVRRLTDIISKNIRTAA
ncbi:MAG: hypothetical protein Q8N91_04520, partial [Candidatus Omnitrophota bacterium]|nr:hypothetical protein [Candidatus Omnitrophota bacterium]